MWGICDATDLTDIQIRAIELAIQGLNDSQIAETLSISRKTIWRWKTFDENYRQVLTECRAQAHGYATDRYQVLLIRATSVLAEFLSDTNDNNRFRAAQVLLNMAGCFRPETKFVASSTSNPDDEYWPEPQLPPKVG
jgi:hypothetical protein